ncbi:uncharacterized protein LOC141668035 [Apium graveolens]|uniref:uncharacterized protein LOC141668035 n=1 Tax=Apium graveolens TaxID=4045 RepID=UPI003D7AAA62
MSDKQYNSYEAPAAEASKTVHKGLVGVPVLEVYSITYLGSSPVEAQDQIGSISLTTDDMRYNLYVETKVDPNKPSIKYGDQLPMRNVGPICSFTDLRLKFDLFSGEYIGPNNNEVVVRFRKDRDCLEKRSIKSEDGYRRHISVLFGCFSNATIAHVKVKFFPHATSYAKTNVHGVVVASNRKFGHPCTSYLFSDSTTQVVHHGVIPLSKSRVGVPLGSHLYVDISLFCDGLQHIGTAKFTPKINDKESQFVDEKILVEVTWNYNEDSDFTDEDSDLTDGDLDFTNEDFSSIDEFDSASEREYE